MDFIVCKEKLLTIGKLMENTLLKHYFKWLSTCTNINFHQKFSQNIKMHKIYQLPIYKLQISYEIQTKMSQKLIPKIIIVISFNYSINRHIHM